MRSDKKVHISVILDAFTPISHFYSCGYAWGSNRTETCSLYENNCAWRYL